MKYVINYGHAASHHSLLGKFLSVRCFGVECHWLVSWLISQLISYLIVVITSITDIFMSIAIPFVLQIGDIWN